jgi:hypothetical protein
MFYVSYIRNVLYCGWYTASTYIVRLYSMHCKDTIPKIQNKYFPEKKLRVSVPISTFICLWAIYIFPQLVCLFCCRKICGPILGIYNRSQTLECGNWDWGGAIPFLRKHKWDFRCNVFVLCGLTKIDYNYLIDVWKQSNTVPVAGSLKVFLEGSGVLHR